MARSFPLTCCLFTAGCWWACAGNCHRTRAAVTPAGALAEAQGPGPEGAAEYFIVKVGSGLFDRDFSRYSKPAGKILHFVYGSFWGSFTPFSKAKAGAMSGSQNSPWISCLERRTRLPRSRHAANAAPWKAPKRQTALMVAGISYTAWS